MGKGEDSHCITIDKPDLAKASSSGVPPPALDQAKRLEEDCKTSSKANYWTIFKVPERLRQVNRKAYEPNLVSIGPYHHGKEHLKAMEDVKKSVFSNMIAETGREPLEFVTAMKDMEPKVRERYSESLDYIGSEALVNMMILDGCFIVQLFRHKLSSSSDSFLQLRGIWIEIDYDLLLLENQLPFVVLSELYGMMERVNNGEDKFARLAISELAYLVPGGKPFKRPGKAPENIKHLLGLVHDSWQPQGSGTEDGGSEHEAMPEFISCARELEEAGINFAVKHGNGKTEEASLFDIEFTGGELKIPTLHIDDQTEIVFRNLVAYEQFIPFSEPKYVCDYVVFMDNLINSSMDVQLLRQSKVIANWLGSDQAVADMFNKLHDFTYYWGSKFYYAEMYSEVHKHCGKLCNKWKAKLKKDYFNYPWSLLSVVAAVVLLLLTVQQSIFSVLSYVHHR